MQLGRVIGSAASTVKDQRLTGVKLLVVQPVRPDGDPVGVPVVAEDAVGAGRNQTVLVVTGGPAREASRAPGAPVDAVIVAIVDDVSTEDR